MKSEAERPVPGRDGRPDDVFPVQPPNPTANRVIALADGRRFRVTLVWPDDYEVEELKGERT